MDRDTMFAQWLQKGQQVDESDDVVMRVLRAEFNSLYTLMFAVKKPIDTQFKNGDNHENREANQGTSPALDERTSPFPQAAAIS